MDSQEELRYEWNNQLPLTETGFIKRVYNRIQKEYGMPLSGFRLSLLLMRRRIGIGTSSTLVVAIVGAFVEMLRLRWVSTISLILLMKLNEMI
jgi:D-glycero-alpha-D-manno-heptose-7-phosphate kinase